MHSKRWNVTGYFLFFCCDQSLANRFLTLLEDIGMGLGRIGDACRLNLSLDGGSRTVVDAGAHVLFA